MAKLLRNIPLFGHPVGVKALVRDAATARIGLYWAKKFHALSRAGWRMRHGKVCDNSIAIKPSILKQGNGANAELAAPGTSEHNATNTTQQGR